jgi:hypothetical protein
MRIFVISPGIAIDLRITGGELIYYFYVSLLRINQYFYETKLVSCQIQYYDKKRRV